MKLLLLALAKPLLAGSIFGAGMKYESVRANVEFELRAAQKAQLDLRDLERKLDAAHKEGRPVPAPAPAPAHEHEHEHAPAPEAPDNN